ncbi:MAG TPA: Ig-like domain-containing protein, partial [Anaerolineales bacterium]|nr:Ig-like domain-containing protein [Anaerolineales bacterium]
AIITRALVEYTDASGASIAERRLIDDLTLVYAEAELPPDAPPVVEITSPTDGSAPSGTTINLRASIWEDRELGEVRYQIDGGEETVLGAPHSLTDPSAYYTGVNFSASLLSPGVPHILTISALDRAGHFASDSVTIILPTPVPSIDIQAVKMEVVQVVQCLNNRHCEDNAVPMVQGKPTWVRVYVRSEGGSPSRPISGRLCRGRVTTCDTAYVNPINTLLPDGDEDPSESDRNTLETSLNFILPPAWLTGDRLELTAFVNYEEEDMDETRGDNNAVQAAVRVTPPRRLTVMFRSVTADGITAPSSEMFSLVDWLSRVFPVARITPIWRGPLRGDFDLSDSSGDNCGRTWNVLMDSLRRAYTWSGPGTGYLFGMVPEEARRDGVAGCGELPGRVASGKVTPGRREGARVAAQEFGHNFGRRHATRCGRADNPDGSYPVRNGHLDDLGLDLVLRQPYPRVSSYDYMGYCGGQDNTWTSVYTYLALLGSLPVADVPSSGAHLAALAAADGEPVWVGGGQLSPEGFILEHGFYRAALAEGIEDGLPVGPFTAQLRDADEAILFERPFGLIEMSNAEPTDSGTFQIILPDVAGASQVVFLYQGAEIGRVSASANAPQVSIIEPAGGEDWGASGAHTIAWEARDADGDALRFNVQYSTDGGAAWSSIDVDLTDATSLTVDSANLPGGSLLFRVLASDGLNQSESVISAPVSVGDKAPMIHVASPAEGDAFPVGEAVILQGYATDFEDIVMEDDAYRWSSDLDGDLGAGPTLWGIPLSAGNHQITLTVTDRSGQTAAQSVRIRVGGETPAPAGRPPLALALVLAGGVLLLGSIGGILFFMMRARRT